MKSLGVVSGPVSDRWWATLVENYTKWYRYYHTLAHIAAMIKVGDTLPVERREVFELAVWFHDIVYIPERKDNEQASIKLFEKFAYDA
mgnify:CR=1 FL=1